MWVLHKYGPYNRSMLKKRKEIKPHFVTNNYLEVLVNDEATTLEQLL